MQPSMLSFAEEVQPGLHLCSRTCNAFERTADELTCTSVNKLVNMDDNGFMEIIKGMCIMDNDGNRVLAKYYDKNVLPTVKDQKAFEKNLFNKTHRSDTEIIMLDGLTCVYKSNVDLFFYVMGSAYENELILLSVLNCLYDSISLILKKNVEKRLVLDNLEIIMLAFDEICDGGIILDADPSSVVKRVDLRNDDIPIGEQTVAQVFQSAREQLKWSILK